MSRNIRRLKGQDACDVAWQVESCPKSTVTMLSTHLSNIHVPQRSRKIYAQRPTQESQLKCDPNGAAGTAQLNDVPQVV
jgi:hypothetical protein